VRPRARAGARLPPASPRRRGRPMRPRLPAALLALALAFAPAQSAAPQRTHAVTIDDFFSLAQPTEVALAPGGNLVAYAEARWRKFRDRKSLPPTWIRVGVRTLFSW